MIAVARASSRLRRRSQLTPMSAAPEASRARDADMSGGAGKFWRRAARERFAHDGLAKPHGRLLNAMVHDESDGERQGHAGQGEEPMRKRAAIDPDRVFESG
jgi:hypothetical protein